jgi:hypothetical protein
MANSSGSSRPRPKDVGSDILAGEVGCFDEPTFGGEKMGADLYFREKPSVEAVLIGCALIVAFVFGAIAFDALFGDFIGIL